MGRRMNRVCWLMIGDGRDAYHDVSRRSLAAHLPAPFDVVHVDDRDHQLGFAGAIAEGWRHALNSGADFVWHHELDFTYNADVPINDIAALLDRRPELVQVALKRQPVNEQEIAAGGIVEQHPDDFTEVQDDQAVWTEHRRFFTTNPSLYRINLCARGWPQVPFSEGIFTHRLLEDPDLRFAFWGHKLAPPLVHHIGDTRAGAGY